MEEVMSKKERISRYVVLCLLSVFILTPFVLGLWTSFLPTADISSGSLFSTHISLDNYVNAMKNTAIIRYLLNSLVISVLTTAFQLLNECLCVRLFEIQRPQFPVRPVPCHDDAAV